MAIITADNFNFIDTVFCFVASIPIVVLLNSTLVEANSMFFTYGIEIFRYVKICPIDCDVEKIGFSS